MARPIWALRLIRCMMVCGAMLGGGQSASAQDGWDFVFAPYLLAPSIDGTTTLGRVGGDISVDPGDIFRNLEAGGMLRFEGRHCSGFGFSTDVAFMRLGKGATSPVGQVNLEVKQRIVEAYATYRFAAGSDMFDAYAGVRHWDISTDLNVLTGPAAGALSRGGAWADPVIGLRWQRRMSPDWRLMVQGDIGGFGVGSDFSWNMMGGLAYDRWQNTSIFMMYRALGVDYETGTRGTASFFEYDTVTHGLLAGVGFRF